MSHLSKYIEYSYSISLTQTTKTVQKLPNSQEGNFLVCAVLMFRTAVSQNPYNKVKWSEVQSQSPDIIYSMLLARHCIPI
jgi:hypothetical protein